MTRVGVISDTHGLVRPEALGALEGSDLIIHAGDVGHPRVLEALRAIAPVRAVRGNVDCEPWAQELPLTEAVEVEGVCVYLLHNLDELDIDPVAAGFAVVVSGHSHQPRVEQRGDVLFLNPGSAGPRRFRLPVSVAQMTVRGNEVSAEWLELAV